MKRYLKYIVPSSLILLLGLGWAVAQVITASVQLSQDPRGPIGLDASRNVYFYTHVLAPGGVTPAVSSCGGGTPAIVGSDTAGYVTEGTSAATCTNTFSQAYAAPPWCVVTSQTGASPVGYTPAAATLVVTNTSVSGLVFNYICTGAQ